MKIVNENKKIYKFLNKLKLKLYLTPTQLRYLALCMYFYFEIYFDGKMTNISNIYFCETNRSSINRFITSSPWDEKKILQILKTNVISSIQDITNKSKKPIELIIDDTISKKSKPSSRGSEREAAVYCNLAGNLLHDSTQDTKNSRFIILN